MLTFGLASKGSHNNGTLNQILNTHSGLEMYCKNYVAVNTITSGNTIGKKLAV